MMNFGFLLPSRFDAELVIHGESELLFAAEIVFRCLDGDVAEQELDLVELAARQMAETRTCSAQIVGRQLVYSRSRGRFLDDLPQHFRGHAVTRDLS